MPFISAIRWSRSARWREASVFTFSAGALLVTPESQQRGDFRYRKAELGGASDELKLMNVVIAVVAIAVLAPRSWRQKADRFVVTDHFRAHPGRCGSRANIHVRNSLDLPTVGRSSEIEEALQPRKSIATTDTAPCRPTPRIRTRRLIA